MRVFGDEGEARSLGVPSHGGRPASRGGQAHAAAVAGVLPVEGEARGGRCMQVPGATGHARASPFPLWSRGKLSDVPSGCVTDERLSVEDERS